MMEFNDMLKVLLMSKIPNILENGKLSLSMILFTFFLIICYNYYINTDFNVILQDMYHGVNKLKCSINYEGTKTSTICRWSGRPRITYDLSEELITIIKYISETKDNVFIYNHNFFNKINIKHFFYKDDEEDNKKNSLIENSFYLIDQELSLLFDKKNQIYAKVSIISRNNEDNNGKNNSRTTQFNIELFSYECNIEKIKNIVNNQMNYYKNIIKKEREKNIYIYKLETTKTEDTKYDCWSENLFESSRSFKNMFFENKEKILEKIDFFLNNKKWYYEKGIPHTMGIALYGEPGTGKTSFIKSLANYTNRHIIILSFKTIKTVRDLELFFYENMYSYDNEKNSIGFDKKIIVFEDIDCASEIVFSRDIKNNKNNENNIINLNTKTNELIESLISTNKICDSNVSNNDNTESKIENSSKVAYSIKKDDDLITLDDILNLFDGLREVSGRIIVLTTNHYDKLDNALKRPGRIDLPIHLGYISKEIFYKMSKHLFNDFYENDLKLFDDNFFDIVKKTPAEIINIYVANSNNKKDFIQHILNLNKI